QIVVGEAVHPAGGDVLALGHDLRGSALLGEALDAHAEPRVGARGVATFALPRSLRRHQLLPCPRRRRVRGASSNARSHSRAGTSTLATMTSTASPSTNRRRVRRPIMRT